MINISEIQSLHIELSSNCNAQCPCCPRTPNIGVGKYQNYNQNLTVQNIKDFLHPKIIRQLNHITFCGNVGDPSMCPEIIGILNYLREENPSINFYMNTNGGARTPEFWSELAQFFKTDLSSIVFGIDGLEDTNHLYRRNVQWEKLIANVEAFISAGGNAIWEFLLFQHNEQQVEDVELLSKRMGFKSFVKKSPFGFENGQPIVVMTSDGDLDYLIEPSFRYDKSHSNIDIIQYQLRKKELTKSWSSIREQQELSSEDYADNFKKINVKDGKNINCKMLGTKELFISAEGLLFPCCYLASYYTTPLKSIYSEQTKKIIRTIGTKGISLHNNSFESVLENKWFKSELQQSWEKDFIDGCPAVCYVNCNSKSQFSSILENNNCERIEKI